MKKFVTCWLIASLLPFFGPAGLASAADAVPFTVADIKAVLGPPTDGDDDLLDYRNKLNVSITAGSHMEVMVEGNRAASALAAKLFESKLFTAEEGRGILALLKDKEGDKTIGQFDVVVKESIVVNGMVIIKLTPKKK